MPVLGKTQAKNYKMRLKMVSVRIGKHKTKKPFDFSKGFLKMVPRSGFEPMTYRLEGGCSIQLSYRGLLKYFRNFCNSILYH